MRKRFNLTWRVVIALLLLVALVPALVASVAVAESTPPTLLSMNWVDMNGNGQIDGGTVGAEPNGDYIFFYFSESMLTGTADTLSEINDLLDSSATGTNDYGSNNAAVLWLAGDTVLRVTLGDDCSTQLSGKTVDPKAGLKDRSGNGDATSGTLPSIPAAQDTTAPTLLSINWKDTSGDGKMGGGDDLIFCFSEQMEATTITAATVNTVLDSSATGTTDYGTIAFGLIVRWGSTYAGGTDCWVDVQLGTDCSTALGGATVDPTAAVTDKKLNPDASTAVSIPLPPDSTPPTLIGIGWNDSDLNSLITPNDQLIFAFSEAMDTTIIVPGNIDTLLKPSGPMPAYTYGTGTLATLSWDGTKTLLTVTLGTAGGGAILPQGNESVDPTAAVLDAAGNADNTLGTGPRIPITPATVTKETTTPTLRSVTWVDTNTDGNIGPGDQIVFSFSESMNTSPIDTPTEINQKLDSMAPGTNDYGTVAAVAVWNTPKDTMLTVTLGSDCSTQLGGIYNANGRTVNPTSAVTDKAGNADATTGVGPAIPLAPDTLQPTLLSISWVDTDADFTIDSTDVLRFSFSESMKTTTWPPDTSDIDLDSSAVGAVDYNTAGDVWSADGTRLSVTLGATPSIDLVDGKLSCTVNPSPRVTDVKGNTDGTQGNGPAIPLPPDKTNPTLTSIVWSDVDGNGQMNQGDRLVFQFSEAMRDTDIASVADLNTRLDSTALGVLDYGDGFTTPLPLFSWTVPSYTELTVTLGAGEQIDGGEWVNPTDAIHDRIGNRDMTPGGGVQIPTVSGTPATLTVLPTSRTFNYYINGSAPASQTVSISNGGTQTLTWSVTSPTKSWLNVTPTSGTISGIGSNTLTLSVNVSGLNVSANTDTITVTGAGSSQAITVTLNILAEVIPTPTPTATPNASATPTPAPATPTPAPTTAPTATPTATPTPGTTASASIGTDGGVVEIAGKVKITFPAGAFDTATTVTVTSGTCTHDDTDAFTVGGTCFSVTPSGALGEPAEICVQLSSYDLNIVNDDTSKLTLGYWANSKWNEATDVTVTDNEICGQTTHLSDWAVLGSTGEGWLWWYWALIGGGAFIVVLAIILLLVLPKRGKGEEIPSEELYGEEEEEF